MNELHIVGHVLTKIIDQHANFSDALKEAVQEASASASQGLIRSLTSCELHHHRLLAHVVNRFVNQLSSHYKFVVQAAIGNNVFVKRLPYDQVMVFLQQFLLEKEISKISIDELLSLASPCKNLIDPQIKENSITYLGIKYNTPEWLVLMWIKHFGLTITLKILTTNNKPVLQACRVNTLRTTTEKLLKQFPDLS